MKNNNESPYTRGDAVWHDVHAYYVKTASTWRTAFFVTFLALLASLFVSFSLAQQKKIVPYFVQVDKLGNKIVTGVIGEVNGDSIDNLIVAELSQFIFDVRQTTLDAGVLNQKITDAYNNILPQSSAQERINKYFRERDPFKLASEYTVNVSIDRILPLTKYSYQIEWTEKTFQRNGGMETNSESWQAILNFQLKTPTTQEVILKNPAGLFIEDFTWGKKL